MRRKPSLSFFKGDVPIFLDDQGPFKNNRRLNAGFMYFPRSNQTLEFLERYRRALLRSRMRGDDQSILNRNKPIAYSLFPARLFYNGFNFYENRHKSPVDKALVMVHHNWISGDQAKWKRANDYSCIARPSSAHFVQDALVALDKPRWIHSKQ